MEFLTNESQRAGNMSNAKLTFIVSPPPPLKYALTHCLSIDLPSQSS